MATAADTSGSTPPPPPPPPVVKNADAEAGSSQLAFVKGLMAGLGELAQGSEERREFAELTSAEMMDSLTRRLVRWQQDYGKWGER